MTENRKPKTENASLADKVRQALAQGPGALLDIASRAGVKPRDYHGRQRVRLTLRDLVRRGEVAEFSPPKVYCLAAPLARAEKQERVWRFLTVKAAKAEGASIRDMVKLTGATEDYVKRYLRWLHQCHQAVEVAGRKGNAYLWRLAPGWEHKPAPRWSRLREEGKSRGQGSGVRGQ